MKVCVEVYSSINAYEDGAEAFRSYTMNHDDPGERRVLGEQCRNAFEGAQVIVTYPKP